MSVNKNISALPTAAITIIFVFFFHGIVHIRDNILRDSPKEIRYNTP